MNQTNPALLRRIEPGDISRNARPPVDRETLDAVRIIVDEVRANGIRAVRAYAERFMERAAEEPLILGPNEMNAARDALDGEKRAVLERTARRIEAFARAQREAITEIDMAIPGGRAGHTIEPVASAGCYAPAGRYPLPATVLMTAVTARVAGCDRVVVISPGAHPVMLAAAAIAGADTFLAAGGAHAVAAAAYGIEGLEPCDLIVGPGNRWVTAAKQLVNGVVGIDMLAGPSELLVLADETAEPALVAADLLAQAEHDTDAVPMLVSTSFDLARSVEAELEHQLIELPTRETAGAALRNGFSCVVDSTREMVAIADLVAAEHVEVMTRDPESVAVKLRNAGAVFLGAWCAEVFGDYGAGPNHTLPTGGTARFRAGLSVMHFLRLRTWMRIDDAEESRPLIDDAATLASMEGLAAHRASALARKPG